MTNKSRAGELAEQLKDTADLIEKGVLPRDMGKQAVKSADVQTPEQKERLRRAKEKLRQFWEE